MALGDYDSLGPESGFPVMVDPEFADCLELVAEYQKEFDSMPNVRRSHLLEVLDKLNGRYPYMHEEVRVSGYTKTAFLDPVIQHGHELDDESCDESGDTIVAQRVDGDAEEEITFLNNDQGYIANGFAVKKEAWPEAVGGYDIGYRSVICFVFGREVEINLADEESCTLPQTILADIDQIVIQSLDMTPEMASIRAWEFFPDALQQYEANISDNMSLSEKLLCLRDIVFQVNRHITVNEKIALETHLTRRLGFDSVDTPFIVNFPKETILFGDRDQAEMSLRFNASRYVLALQALRVFGKAEITIGEGDDVAAVFDRSVLEPRVVCQVLGRTVFDDSAVAELRLADIENIDNIRDLLGTTIKSET